MDAEEIGRLIGELENRVERLRSLYEQYFMGIERLEPLTLRKDIDRRLWALRREQIRNTGLRFKLETTIQRYNTYQQYWQRIVREIEQGTYQRDIGRAAQRFGDNAVTAFARRRQKMYEKAVVKKAERDGLRRTGSGASQAPAAETDDDAPPSSNETYDVTFEEPATAQPAAAPSPPVPIPEPHVPLELEISEPAPPRPPAPQRDAAGLPKTGATPLAGQRQGFPAPAAAAARAPLPGAQRPPAADTAAARVPSPGAPRPPAADTPPPYARPPDHAANPAPSRPAAAAPPPRAPFASSSRHGLAPGAPKPAVPARPNPPASPIGTAPKPAPAVAAGTGPATMATAAKPPMPAATPTQPATVIANPAKPAAAPLRPAVSPIDRPAATRPLATAPVAAKPAVPAAPKAAPPPVRPPAPSRPDAPSAAVLGEDNSLSPIRMRQIYGAFVEAKRKANESTATVTYEKIASNLENVAKELRAKHKARSVDFEVVMKNGKPVLKPVVKG